MPSDSLYEIVGCLTDIVIEEQDPTVVRTLTQNTKAGENRDADVTGESRGARPGWLRIAKQLGQAIQSRAARQSDDVRPPIPTRRRSQRLPSQLIKMLREKAQKADL